MSGLREDDRVNDVEGGQELRVEVPRGKAEPGAVVTHDDFLDRAAAHSGPSRQDAFPTVIVGEEGQGPGAQQSWLCLSRQAAASVARIGSRRSSR